jgi:hypothetical protein
MKKDQHTFTENDRNKGVLEKLRTFAGKADRSLSSYMSWLFTKHIEEKKGNKE